jgi:hypothetical protein
MMLTPAARLAALRGQDVHRLHAGGVAPDPFELSGVIDGAVLTGSLSRPVVREIRLWRGKVFTSKRGEVGGLNRLGSTTTSPSTRRTSGGSMTSSSSSRRASTSLRHTTGPGPSSATSATSLWRQS